MLRRKFIHYPNRNKKISLFRNKLKNKNKSCEVPPRFELGSLNSESRVLTITPWDPVYKEGQKRMIHKHSEIFVSLFINIKKCVVNTRFEKFGSSNRIQVKVQKQHQETTTKTQAIIKNATQ